MFLVLPCTWDAVCVCDIARCFPSFGLIAKEPRTRAGRATRCSKHESLRYTYEAARRLI